MQTMTQDKMPSPQRLTRNKSETIEQCKARTMAKSGLDTYNITETCCLGLETSDRQVITPSLLDRAEESPTLTVPST